MPAQRLRLFLEEHQNSGDAVAATESAVCRLVGVQDAQRCGEVVWVVCEACEKGINDLCKQQQRQQQKQ